MFFKNEEFAKKLNENKVPKKKHHMSYKKKALIERSILGTIIIALSFYIAYDIYTEPKEIIVTRILTKPYAIGEDVNAELKRMMEEGKTELIYEFYDSYTKDREVTVNAISAALLYDIPLHFFMGLIHTESRFVKNAVGNGRTEK